MKKLYLFTLLILPVASQAQVGLINNGDFENWATNIAGQTIADFETSDQEFPGVGTITQSTDAAHLTYSVILETQDYFGDTAFAYIINGSIDGTTFSGGYPHNTNIDSLKIRVKYDVMPGDSATIALIQHGGSFPWIDIYKLTGTQNSWTTLAFPVTAVAHDTIIFAVSSSNAFADYAIPGSTLQIDHVELVNNSGTNDDFTNNSFENWTDITYEDPNGWDTYNNLGALAGLAVTLKSTDAYSGTYAAELVVEEFNGDTVNPMITNGTIDLMLGATGGVPYTSMPTNFEGAYQWEPAAIGDSAYLLIAFRNGGTLVGGNVITLGDGQATMGTYQTFNIATNLFATPDTMLIAAYTNASPGTSFHLDALQLTGNGVGVMEWSNNFQFYPNPAKEIINVGGANTTTLLRLYDMNGRKVLESRGTKLNVANLTNGIYSLVIDQASPQKVVVVH